MALSNFFWDSAKPVNSTLIPDGPQAWRYVVGNVSSLFGSEHHTFPVNENVGAWHLPGSAVLLTGTTRPTTRLDTSAFDVNDNGRIFYDTDVEELEVLTAFGGPTWVSFGSLSAAHAWASLQTFSLGFTSTVAPTWSAGVVAKDAYITAVDQAETGIVNLIGANASDKPELPDGAVLAAATEAGDGDRTIADKAYVDAGGTRPVNGTPTRVFTKYFKGNLDADAETSIAHGVTVSKILHVSAFVFEDENSVYAVGDYRLPDANSASDKAFILNFDASNVIFTTVGSKIQGNTYKIKIEYEE